MNPLYALREWRRSRRLPQPYVKRISASALHAQRVRNKRRAVRQAKLDATLRALAAWWSTRWRSAFATSGFVSAAWAVSLLMAVQPVLDAKDQELATIRAQRDEWRDVATRTARGELTINLSGSRADVQKHVRAIANLER